MAFVTLDSDGKVTGQFASPQPGLDGFAEIDDNDPRLKSIDGIALEAEIRAKRGPLLIEADIAINIAEDNGRDASALRAYRQALRDVTEQKKFPKSVMWPEFPK